MIRVKLDVHALGRVRIMYSPMWELTSSLRLLIHDPRNGRHRPWSSWARDRVDDDLLATLRCLMPQPFRFPDFLTPQPGLRPRSVTKELEQVAQLDVRTVLDQLDDAGQWPPPASMTWPKAETVPRIVAALQAYWQVAVEPVWPRIRHLLAADLAFRADELAAEGLRVTLNRLHPTLAFDGEQLVVRTPRHETFRHQGVNSLTLVPSVFAWPQALVVACDPNPVCVSYAPRGAGALWHEQRQPLDNPVVELIGRSRAAILSLLDLPVSASQVAEQTGLSLPVVSQHLAVLRKAGLISSRRAGRTVWSTRTPLGNALLEARSD